VIISASVGAGHDGAAAELSRRLSALGFAVDRHDFLDLLPGTWGARLRQAYLLQVRIAPRSWACVFAATGGRHVTHKVTAAFVRLAGSRVREVVGTDAAAVVSTYPFASQVLGKLVEQGLLTAPVATFLTDMSVHPLWVARGVSAHLALHPVAARQAALLGAAGVRVTGPAVPPAFRPPTAEAERHAARDAFGLAAGVPAALVVAGSWGVGPVARAARDIAATGLATPVVACGHNEALRRELATRSGVLAMGWTEDMPRLMRACDVVVQNAGGLTSLEALASGLPMLTYRCLTGHGRTNAMALHEAGWAPWIRERTELAPALRHAITTRPAPEWLLAEDPAYAIAALAASPAVRP
jgi:UDP-N-acetylglucosamine:LPS N-acetylglucosamine transferase